MPSPLAATCPHCKATLKLKSRESDGKKVRCPKCEKPFVVKLPADDEDAVDVWEVPSEDEAEEEAASRPIASRKSSGKGTGRKKKSKQPSWQKPALLAGGVLLAVALVGGLGFGVLHLLQKPKTGPGAAENSTGANGTAGKSAPENHLFGGDAPERKQKSKDNLKRIGLAMHNFHNVNNKFPDAALFDKSGKPGLSWRVAILPYLDQGELYKKFHLDEPWDSPHNMALVFEVPKVYDAAPVAPAPDPAHPGWSGAGLTYYRMISGPRTLFGPPEAAGRAPSIENANFGRPVEDVPAESKDKVLDPRQQAQGSSFRDILDGTSLTLLVVEALEPVPWTKPGELVFDPAPSAPLPQFGGLKLGTGFQAVFCDGAVHWINEQATPAILRALITRSGGEVINFP